MNFEILEYILIEISNNQAVNINFNFVYLQPTGI